MKSFSSLKLAAVISACLAAAPSFAGDKDALFVNLTSDDAHRANMAMSLGQDQLRRGHPLTIFLNDRGVYLASTANSDKFADQQTKLESIMAEGGTIISYGYRDG